MIFPDSCATQEHVRTEDGWTLVVHHWQPRSARQGDGLGAQVPVVLVHGFGANAFCFHDLEGSCLGRHLAERGRDVWIPELRGTRSSTPPRSHRARSSHAGPAAAVTVANKLDLDLGAVLAHVTRRTGREELDAVGHSLGGTLLFAYCVAGGRPSIRRCVGVAAAARYRMSPAARAVARLAPASRAWRRMPRRVPLRALCSLGARTRIIAPAHEHFNVENVDRAVLLRMMRDGVEDATLDELRELASWSLRRDEGCDDPGRVLGGSALLERLPAASAPLLVLAGAADRHVPASEVHAVAAAWGGTPKQVRILGRSSGCRLDYGHTDLLLGSRARDEVFPAIVEWLRG